MRRLTSRSRGSLVTACGLALVVLATAGFKCGAGGPSVGNNGPDGGVTICMTSSDCGSGGTCVPWAGETTIQQCTGQFLTCFPNEGNPYSTCNCSGLGCSGNLNAVCGGHCVYGGSGTGSPCATDSDCSANQVCTLASTACGSGQTCDTKTGYCEICRPDQSACSPMPCAFENNGDVCQTGVCNLSNQYCYAQADTTGGGSSCSQGITATCPAGQGCTESLTCAPIATCGTCTANSPNPPPPPPPANDASTGCTAAGTPVIDEFAVTSTLGAAPSGVVQGPDGNMWFALNAAPGGTGGNSGSAIGRISPDGQTQTSFALPTQGAGPAEMCVGPDGNLWFTEFGAGKIGRISPSGTNAVEIALPMPGAQPNGIAAGPDGNVWFTDSGANAIGWVSPTGTTPTEIPLPESNSLPAAIHAESDGNVWFSEQRGNRIAKIATTAGAMPVEYTIPTTVNPHGFTFGPDGNVWFTEFGNTDVGHISVTGGSFQDLSVGTTSWTIVTGPDDNLWFTENEVGNVGRVTVSGTVTSFAVPTPGGNTTDIATGPNGTVWFTEQGNNKLGRVTVCAGGDGGS
jgi:virginiamycin B lyase